MIGGAWRARTMRHLPALVLLIAAGAQIAAQPRGPAAIVFPTSGSPAAHAEFLIGVAALHNFEYEDANAAFIKAQQIDPGFAMAYWGEAMTYHQTLWQNEDVAAARRILLRLAPDAAARAARAGTERERGFLAAVEALFGDRRRHRAACRVRARDGGELRAVPGRSGSRHLLCAGAARHDGARTGGCGGCARGTQRGAGRQRDPDRA